MDLFGKIGKETVDRKKRNSVRSELTDYRIIVITCTGDNGKAKEKDHEDTENRNEKRSVIIALHHLKNLMPIQIPATITTIMINVLITVPTETPLMEIPFAMIS